VQGLISKNVKSAETNDIFKLKSWIFFLLLCHVACHDWSTWHTVSFGFCFL